MDGKQLPSPSTQTGSFYQAIFGCGWQEWPEKCNIYVRNIYRSSRSTYCTFILKLAKRPFRENGTDCCSLRGKGYKEAL